MKQSCRDLSVFDFSKEAEVTDTFPQWCKIPDPSNSVNKDNQFSSHYEVHTVEHIHVLAIDDVSHGFNGDVLHSPLDLLRNAGSKQSASLGVTADRPLGHCEDIVKPESSSTDTETKDSSPFRSSPVNGYTNSTFPDSPYSDGSADGQTPNDDDSIRERCIPAPASLLDENTGYAQAQETSVSGLDMEGDAIVLYTDFVTFRTKYFPASPILISKDSIKLEALAFEEEIDACWLEWEIDDILRIETQWNSMANTVNVKFHLLTKYAMRAEKSCDISGVEVLEFLVHDPDWSRRQERIMSLNVRLNALWSAEMNSRSCDRDVENRESAYPYIPNFEEPFEEVIYPEGDVDAVSISKRDFDLLQPETFINDTIIDFYMKYLKNEILSEERHRYHFFNSFFFRKLADLDKNPSSASDGRAAFQRVRKWTRKVNIFEKDYIFIPVNYNLHWSLLVICYPGEVSSFNVSDENVDEPLRAPCILHMDSIRGSHTGLKDLLQSYLLEEWKERQKETSEDISSKFLQLRFFSLELPQQENCSDCGLFLLHYAELFLAEAPSNLNPFRINEFDCFLKPDWFVPAEASLKRVHIQRLIYELLENRSHGIALPSCNSEVHPSVVHENSEHDDNGIEIILDKRSPGQNRKVSFSQPVQGMEIDLLDVPLYRHTSRCIENPGLGTTELLQLCEPYDLGASVVQLRCPMLPSREELEDDKNLAHSTLGEQTETDFCRRLAWNSDSSDNDEPNDGSSTVSDCPSDDSDEVMIIESQNLEELKENMDSLTESYASDSSDMMETPPEDSQELDRKFGSNDQDLLSNPEEVPHPSSPQELDRNDENGEDAPILVERSLVEDSSPDSDEDRPSKKMRLTLTPPCIGIASLSNETLSATLEQRPSS